MSNHTDRIALVTGTSSGIGAAVAHALLQRGWRVIGGARREADISHSHYTHLSLDLADLQALADTVEARLAPLLATPGIKRVGLVNNAADIGLLGPMQQVDPARLMALYAVNVVAPIWLMGWCVRHCAAGAALRIVNVSTGAAAHPMPGLGAYGSSKAALRMAGMVLAAELGDGSRQHTAGPDVGILSYEPGVVDTPMQVAARSSAAEVLPSVDAFRHFHDDGLLVSPEHPAADIADYLDSDGRGRFSEQRLGEPPGS